MPSIPHIEALKLFGPRKEVMLEEKAMAGAVPFIK